MRALLPAAVLLALPSLAVAGTVDGTTEVEAPAPVRAAAPPGPDDWTGFASVERVAEDVDGDGVLDDVRRGSDHGSGWGTSRRCVRSGATGHEACVTFAGTAYAHFSGRRVHDLRPAEGNSIAAALTAPCVGLDPADPRQGRLRALQRRVPLEGRHRLDALNWAPGAPHAGDPVCLTLAQAEAMPGGIAWWPSGDVEVLRAEGWTAVWSNAIASSVGGRSGPTEGPARGRRALFTTPHAVAVYDADRDAHAWLASFDHSMGDFKTRWRRVVSVAWSGPDVVVQVARSPREDDVADVILEVR